MLQLPFYICWNHVKSCMLIVMWSQRCLQQCNCATVGAAYWFAFR